MQLDRPVLITGTPRSGKSCVWRVLRRATEFAAVEEPVMIWDAALRRPDDCRGADDATRAVQRGIVKRCAALVRRAGKRRYLDNLSQHGVRIPFVHAVMPDARIIHVIRDPVDAVPELLFGWTNRDSLVGAIRRRSFPIDLRALPRLAWKFARNFARSRMRGVRETWGPLFPGLTEYVRTHGPAEIAAYQWTRLVSMAREGLRSVPDLELLEVRYEELVSAPRREALRIAEFAEVESPAACVEFADRALRAGYVHHEPCRRAPTPGEWAAIHAIIDPVRRELGYVGATREVEGEHRVP